MSSQPNPMAAQPDAQSPFHEPAEGILRAEPSIDDAQRADLFDAFHSKNADELTQHLQSLDIPSATKTALWQAKKSMTPAPNPSPVEKITAALRHMSQIEPQTLEIAEKYPTVSKAFIDAAIKTSEKPAAGRSAGPKSAAKGKSSKAAPTSPSTAPDLPTIPTGHALVPAIDLAAKPTS